MSMYKTAMQYAKNGIKKKLGMHAVRGTIVGTRVMFAGRDEIITLSHSARSKEVFAVGAVNAAVFLKRTASRAVRYETN